MPINCRWWRIVVHGGIDGFQAFTFSYHACSSQLNKCATDLVT